MIKEKSDLPIEKDLAGLFKILSHPARVAIIEILAKDEACVCHLEAVLGYRQAYLSQQLAVLRENNLIQDRRDGWNVFYQLNNKQLIQVIQQARLILGQDQQTPYLEPEDCPCPKCAEKQNGDTCC